ncbi:hypothetical protein Tco_1367744 [Tanacetum coccineum]
MLRLKCKQIEMIEHESKPLKRKDQILIDEEIVQNLQAQLNAELEEEEKLTKQSEEDENIVIGIIEGEELESDNSKKQKLDESVEVEVDDETELKRHMEIVVDEEEIAVDAIPLATKPPIIVD